MRTIFSEVRNTDVPFLVMDFGNLLEYLDWEGWVKDLEFDQRIWH